MDIDIDMQSSFKPQDYFPRATIASMLQDGKLLRHPCGTYFQAMAHDPISNLAAIPYREAQDLGYFKIDLLHLSVLDDFSSKAEMRELMKQDPDWELLQEFEVVEKLFHIKNHYELINKLQPTNVQELADAIALIRPGRRHLIDKYMADKEFIRDHLLYVRNAQDDYSFKRSHAIAYAFNIVLQLHLIKQGKL